MLLVVISALPMVVLGLMALNLLKRNEAARAASFARPAAPFGRSLKRRRPWRS